MLIYWDKLFGSFAFVPTSSGEPIAILNQGHATDAAGKPLRREAVTLTVAGKTFHTWTDDRGDYAFLKPEGTAQKEEISIHGFKESVPVESGRTFQIRIP